MLVLDPENAGVLSCRRLCLRRQGRAKGATTCGVGLLFEAAIVTLQCALPRCLRIRRRAGWRKAAARVALAAHHKQLQILEERCPENFENRAALVGAEMARIEGRDVEAMGLYEQAIRSARANGFIHNEAVAYELASRFYAARGFDDIAHVYLRKARDGYLRWGADGKVRQLDQIYPHLVRRSLRPVRRA